MQGGGAATARSGEGAATIRRVSALCRLRSAVRCRRSASRAAATICRLVSALCLLAALASALPARAAGNLYTVTSTGDAPADASCAASCTLRQAVNAANAAPLVAGERHTIQFAPALVGTIALGADRNHGVLLLQRDVTIVGPTSGGGVVVDGGGATQVFAVGVGVAARLEALTVARGAAAFGGGIANRGTLALTGVTVRGSAATSFGGGIYSDTTGTLTLTNSTIISNDAQAGGGIYSSGGTLTMTNVTLTGNTARGSQGGGLFTYATAATLTNTIVAANGDLGGGDPPDDIAGASVGGACNLIGTGGSGGLVDGVDGNRVGVTGPLLGPPGAYGNPSGAWTVPLLPGSAALDAGTASGAPATDQRGVARVGPTDIGAFESRGFSLATTSGDHQAVGINRPFAPLVVQVAGVGGEPVQGGILTFTGPDSGAGIQNSPLAATIAASGQASVAPRAGSTPGGPYAVVVSARGAGAGVVLTLTNLLALTGIGPASGATDGGNRVTLAGVGFGTPATTQVLFDGVALPTAAVIAVGDTAVTFIAPPHAAGTVTITVRVGGVTATGSVVYRYGAVTPLPPPAPPASPVASPQPLPAARAAAGSGGQPPPTPLPVPRP